MTELLREYAAELEEAMDSDDHELTRARVLLVANALRNLAAEHPRASRRAPKNHQWWAD